MRCASQPFVGRERRGSVVPSSSWVAPPPPLGEQVGGRGEPVLGPVAVEVLRHRQAAEGEDALATAVEPMRRVELQRGRCLRAAGRRWVVTNAHVPHVPAPVAEARRTPDDEPGGQDERLGRSLVTEEPGEELLGGLLSHGRRVLEDDGDRRLDDVGQLEVVIATKDSGVAQSCSDVRAGMVTQVLPVMMAVTGSAPAVHWSGQCEPSLGCGAHGETTVPGSGGRDASS